MSQDNKDLKLVEAKAKIEAILKEYNVALVPITLISGENVASRVDIVPIPEDAQASK